MPDEMPANRQIRRAVHLVERFLHFVFAEIQLARIRGRADVFGGKRFRDGDESNAGGIASGPAGRSLDSRANVLQPGSERISHYFLIVPRMPFAVAAFGPDGASFR